MTDADLLNALRDCYAPNSRRNIVAAALVRSATLTPDEDAPGHAIPGVPAKYIAHIELTAPSADEAATAQLRAQLENRLAGLEWISRAEIKVSPPLFPIL
jgi:hypothetical protein